MPRKNPELLVENGYLNKLCI